MRTRADKWKAVVGDGYALVADCHTGDIVADCAICTHYDTDAAHRNARHIAMLPEMVKLLRRIGETAPRGSLTYRKVQDLMARYDAPLKNSRKSTKRQQ